MLGTLLSYATAYLGIIETIETVETKRGVVLLKRNRQVFMFHWNWLKRVQFLSITGVASASKKARIHISMPVGSGGRTYDCG